MHKTILPVLFTLAWLFGCSGGPGPRPAPQPPVVMTPCPLAAPGVDVPISFLVVTNSDGGGNPLWIPDYLTQLLTSASAIVTRPGFFVLDRHQAYNSDILFPLEQAPLTQALCPGMPMDQFTVLISQPHTTVSAGETPTTSGTVQKPCLAMRSRSEVNTPEAIVATAYILVHELGHVLGYGEAPGGETGIHADNWWLHAEGQARLTAWQGQGLRRCGG